MNKRKTCRRILSLALCLLFALALCPARTQAARAARSRQTLLMNGESVTLEAYNIDGYNYFRLRDIAALMKDTVFRFSLETDKSQRIVRAARFGPCTDTLSEGGPDLSASASVSAWRLSVDGTLVKSEVYNIGGNNFYRLRDLSDAFGFAVGYDPERKCVLLSAEKLTGTSAQEEACFAALKTLYADHDNDRGVAALTEAAQIGSARAACELAHGYYYGLYGLEKSAEKAFEYALAAAKGTNTRGLYLYALLLWNGEGAQQDKNAAIACFERAAAQGSTQAQSFLCAQYYTGSEVRQSFQTACGYAKFAADFGDPRACYIYGQCLYFGYAASQNPARALQYFRTAGEGGVIEAIHALGVCYYRGKGVEYNPYIALYYFEQAAAQGYAPSAYNAGLLYAEGIGTEKDLKTAERYMRAAADGGIKEAESWLSAHK